MAERVSLSPNLISAALTVSFSLMIGNRAVGDELPERLLHAEVAGSSRTAGRRA
jgi:hypothetical protein